MRFGRRWFLGGAAAAPGAAWTGGAARPAASALEKDLAAALEKVGLFDVHEHLIAEKDRYSEPVDFFTLASHYALNDAISAGLEGDALATVRDAKAPMERRWKAFEPHWRAAQFTGYGQALRIAIAEIYEVEHITAASLPKINDAIARRNRPGLYDYVLKERAGIDWCLVDPYWSPKPAALEKSYFLLSQRFDGFVTPSSRKSIAALEEISGASIHSLTDLKRALEKTFEQGLKAGMAAVKSGLAYRRELLFHEVPEQDAAADFDALLRGGGEPATGPGPPAHRAFRRLEDYMFHQVVRLADARRIPFQIHTGLAAGNRCWIENMKPTLLNNLFQLYPRVKFDLFHIGYPYEKELGVLAKLYPNVYADFCWAHVISPVGSRHTLDEYLETVPINKILGFGGDYRHPELTYAHARMARSNVAQVLAAKVQAGLWREEQALEAGRMLLRDNALHLFAVKPGA